MPDITDEQIIEWAIEEQFLLFCDEDDVVQIVRSAFQKWSAPAAISQPALMTAPDGWQLVPIEPTMDMLYEIQENAHILPPRGKRIWSMLLKAAPAATPAATGERETIEDACQYAKDIDMPEYRCAVKCQYAALAQPAPVAAPAPAASAITDEQLDALDTFSLSWMAPRGKASVRAYARAVLLAASTLEPARRIVDADVEGED